MFLKWDERPMEGGRGGEGGGEGGRKGERKGGRVRGSQVRLKHTSSQTAVGHTFHSLSLIFLI